MPRALAFITIFAVAASHNFSNDIEVSLMSAETQHDQVSICSINAVRRVVVIARFKSLRPNEMK
jgi:hypothetical protein